MQEALTSLTHKVRSLPGCAGVELQKDLADSSRFTFIERWVSLDAQKAGGALLGRDAFAAVMAAMATAPVKTTSELLVSL